MSGVLLVLLVLAAYRATRLVTADTLLDSLRHRWFLRFPPDDQYRRYERATDALGAKTWALRAHPVRRTHPLGQLIDCPWCIGFWLSGAVVGVVAHWFASIPLPLLVWPAVSAAVGLMATTLDS